MLLNYLDISLSIVLKIEGMFELTFLKILLFLSHQINHIIEEGIIYHKHENREFENKVGQDWKSSHNELGRGKDIDNLLITKDQHYWKNRQWTKR